MIDNISDILKDYPEHLRKLVDDVESKIKKKISQICDENNLDFEITPGAMHLYYRGTKTYTDDNEKISILLELYKNTFDKDMPECKYTNGKWNNEYNYS